MRPFDVRQIISLSTHSLVRTVRRMYVQTPARSTHSVVRTVWRMYVKAPARCAIVTWCLQSAGGGRGRGIKTANKNNPKYFPQTTKKTEQSFPQYGYIQKRDNSRNRLATRRRAETALNRRRRRRRRRKMGPL